MEDLDKQIKLALLSKLMDAMDEKESEKLGGLKKPADEPQAGMAIIEIKPDNDGDADDAEMNPDDLAALLDSDDDEDDDLEDYGDSRLMKKIAAAKAKK